MYFLLSLLLHLALLFSIVVIWTGQPRHEKPPAMYVPSYTYQKPDQPQPAMTQSETKTVSKKVAADKPSVEKDVISTEKQIRNASDVRTSSSSKVTEAINLVGDKKTMPKPLIKLLAKSLATHLVYPKIALDFRVRGMAFVGFVLHPDGTMTNVQLVQSSHAGVLDNEAVAAVTAMSPVKNVGQYLEKEKPMVVGIIFN